MQNLREKEVKMLSNMLSLQANHSNKSDVQDEFIDYWKILIYDQDCKDIISPLMNVGALRQKGVTLHLLLHSDREQILDAPAVYFIRPTEENLKRIVNDCSKKLYRSFHIHFLTRIDRNLLEQFAQDLITVKADTSCITKIVDEYLDFIAVEPTLFTLNIKDSYVLYNAASMQESQIKQYMDRITMGLLSMIRVLGTIPIIRAARGGAADMLAQTLYKSLCENITTRSPVYSLFADCLVSSNAATSDSNGSKPLTSNRPLLLIFDRNADLNPPLMHSSSYQSLMDDLLDHRLNRVTIELNSKNNDAKKKTYDVNTHTDPFFANYATASFPDAVEANEKELGEVSQLESDIRSRSSMAASASASGATDTVTGESLGRDIDNLPEILNKKANLEAHTNILQAIMSKIAARAIPSFFEVECDIVAHSTIDDQKAILELLKDESKGSVEDRARLLLLITIALSASDTMNETNYKPENEQFVDSNGNANLITNIYDDAFVTGCKNMLSPVVAANSGSNAITLSNATVEKCLKSVRFLRKQLKLSPLNTNNMNAKDSNDAFSSLLSSASSHATSLLAKATTFFSKFSPMYVTKVVESLAEGRKSEENMNYSYYDAKASLMANESKSIENMRYSDVIVFMIGGGCYNEYNNLQELIKTKCSASGGGSNNTPILPNSKHITGQHIYFPRNVTYGCTELVCGATFMSQLEKLD